MIRGELSGKGRGRERVYVCICVCVVCTVCPDEKQVTSIYNKTLRSRSVIGLNAGANSFERN